MRIGLTWVINFVIIFTCIIFLILTVHLIIKFIKYIFYTIKKANHDKKVLITKKTILVYFSIAFILYIFFYPSRMSSNGQYIQFVEVTDFSDNEFNRYHYDYDSDRESLNQCYEELSKFRMIRDPLSTIADINGSGPFYSMTAMYINNGEMNSVYIWVFDSEDKDKVYIRRGKQYYRVINADNLYENLSDLIYNRK